MRTSTLRGAGILVAEKLGEGIGIGKTQVLPIVRGPLLPCEKKSDPCMRMCSGVEIKRRETFV
jgi:hypothetical protein